jgi:RNA polymerase sigma-70 factor (ECF subfamily)
VLDVTLTAPDATLVERLRHRDESAFADLVHRYQPLMLRVAQTYVRTPAVAEEVVQETWLAVLAGIDRFEGRASLKTWILRILTNRAKTRGAREARSVPFSCLAGEDVGADEAAVDADRFLGPDHPQFPGHWAAAPTDWRTVPEDRLLGREAREQIKAAIGELPPRQQQVIVLRDVEGWSSEEVCAALVLSEGNQRVLLHRARGRVRRALEAYVES